MVTVSSGAIVIHALISGTVASRYQGWAATGPAAASALEGSQKPRTIATPTAAVVVMNSRRPISLGSDVLLGDVAPSGCSGFFSIIRPPLLAAPCTSVSRCRAHASRGLAFAPLMPNP